MNILKFRALEHAAREIKDNCIMHNDCNDCLFGKEYLTCPFILSDNPDKWEFEKICEEDGMVKHGKWLPVEPDTRGCTYRFTCSVCGGYTTYYEDTHGCDYNYCPNCGAKMDLEDGDVK